MYVKPGVGNETKCINEMGKPLPIGKVFIQAESM